MWRIEREYRKKKRKKKKKVLLKNKCYVSKFMIFYENIIYA